MQKRRQRTLIWQWFSVCQELEYSADEGNVIKMSDAWNEYKFLAEKAGVNIPASFVSRRAIFKDKLMQIVGDVVECVDREGTHLIDTPFLFSKYLPM